MGNMLIKTVTHLFALCFVAIIFHISRKMQLHVVSYIFLSDTCNAKLLSLNTRSTTCGTADSPLFNYDKVKL